MAQLMSATTVLHVSQADIDYIGVWIPGMTCRPLPNLLFISSMHAAEYSLEELMLRMWYVSGQNDPSVELVTP